MDIGVFLKVLWPYLAVLYLLDCILVVRGGHLLFTGNPLFGFRSRGAGLRLAGLLPWNWSILSIREPLILSEAGLYLRTVPFPDDPRPPGPDDLEFIPWEGIREVRRDGRKVLLDGRVVCVAPTGVIAGLLAGRVRTVLNAPADHRSRCVEAVLTGASDLRAIGEAIEVTRRSTGALQKACVLLFLMVFLSIPALLIARVPPSWILGSAVLVLAVCLAVLVLWWKTHRALLPGERSDRVEELLVLAVFPVSLPHALGKLTRRLFAPFDAVALAAALAPDRAVDLLKRELIWTRAAADSGVGRDLVKMWKTRLEILEKLAREIDPGPARAEGHAAQHGEAKGPVCPLCYATYREGITRCADCGVSLWIPTSEPEPSRRPHAGKEYHAGSWEDGVTRGRADTGGTGTK